MSLKEQKYCSLSKRMLAVAKMVTKGNSAVDIGCDHGFVSIYLIEQKISPRVIAMDINEGPLQRVKEHVQERALSSYITIRKSDGAKQLLFIHDKEQTEADSAIIAGMGGRLMVSILSESLDKMKTLQEIILQPQSEIYCLRDFLYSNGFDIVKEDMVFEDGKYYQILKAHFIGNEALKEKYACPSEIELHYGRLLLNSQHMVLKEYLEKEQIKYHSIIKKLRKDYTDDKPFHKLELIEQALACFSEDSIHEMQ